MIIPNLLTILRMVIALMFPFLGVDLQVPFIAVALLTEFLDGAIARKYGWESLFGQILDPVADKLFALSVCVTLLYERQLFLNEFIFIIFRDIVVTVGAIGLIIFTKNFDVVKKFQPHFLGKLTTFFQYLVFFDILLFDQAYPGLIQIAGMVSVFAGVHYIVLFVNQKVKAPIKNTNIKDLKTRPLKLKNKLP